MSDYLKALGYQQMTSLAAATAPTVPVGTTMMLVMVEGQDVRWRDDGTAPTATVGMLVTVGQTLQYDAGQLAVLKFIEVAASAKCNLSYYGT